MTRPAPIPGLLSLVIPVYNERESLGPLHSEIDAAVRAAGLTIEILFIDDGSRDGSWDVVQQLAAEDTRVRGLRFRRNFGKAAALNAGFARAAGDIVMTLDADLQDDPKEIPRFLEMIRSGTDVVSGWKKIRHDPWHKVFPSRVFNWMVSRLTGVKLHDHNCGFKAYRAEVIREVRMYGELHRYVPVLANEAGFTVGELVIHHRARQFGYSKFGARRFLKGFLDLLAVWFRTTFGYRPMHAFGTAAVLLILVGIALHLLLVLIPLGRTIPNLLDFLPLLCWILAAQAFCSGLLAEYTLARSTPDEPFRIAEMTLDSTQKIIMNSLADPTEALRRSIYLLLTFVAVAIVVGKIIGVENVVEPSRYQPPPGTFGSDRVPEFTPKKPWPDVRPEPTPMFGSNDRSRWATVRALVDHGTYVIGQRNNLGATEPPFNDEGIIFEDGWQAVDKVMDPDTGKFYSTKPPLFATMLASEYWLLQQLFGWKFDHDKWPIVITILLTVNVLPFAIYLILLARLIEDYGRSDFAKIFTFIVAAFATFVTTFSVTLNNHTPAVFCALFTLYPLLRKRPTASGESPRELFFSGFFAGLTLTFELPAAAFAFAVAVPLLITRGRATLLYFVPGVLVPIVALMGCLYASMGSLLPAYGSFGGEWYMYPGSHWRKLLDPNATGIDFNRQGTPVYAFNLLLGHHGWFSLTPVWFLGLFGLVTTAKLSAVRDVFQRDPATRSSRVWNLPLLALSTLVISIVVFVFYLMQTKSYNYGGNTATARWLMWLTTLWLFGLLAGAERIANSKAGRRIAAVLLGFSVLSVFYPAWNPWRSPWLLQLAETLDWVHY